MIEVIVEVMVKIMVKLEVMVELTVEIQIKVEVCWLADAKGQYDLIYIDPPTFSNSKRMTDVFDVQRDHVELLRLAMKRLAHGGTLYFSNNYRRFKLDESLMDEFEVKDITGETLDKDFERNRRIHQCWKIQHRL